MNSYGLTKENLVATLPVALQQDASTVALANAIAELLARRPAEIDRLRIYPAIDRLEEPLLDILAYDFKVDWWDADYSLEEKRRTLKDSWRVHKLLGTKAAVEMAISAIYPNTTVEEWFEYGGDPYHFMLKINISDDDVDSVRMRRVLERLNYYKSLRSHNDGIHYFMVPETMIIQALTGIPGIRETMEAAVIAPAPTMPGGEAKALVYAGAVGGKAAMSREIDLGGVAPRGKAEVGVATGVYGATAGMAVAFDLSADVPHGGVAAGASMGTLGEKTITTARLDLDTAVPTGHGVAQTGATAGGQRIGTISRVDMQREKPSLVAYKETSMGFCGQRMKMEAAIDMRQTGYPGGVSAAHAAGTPAGIYQKFTTEVSR